MAARSIVELQGNFQGVITPTWMPGAYSGYSSVPGVDPSRVTSMLGTWQPVDLTGGLEGYRVGKGGVWVPEESRGQDCDPLLYVERDARNLLALKRVNHILSLCDPDRVQGGSSEANKVSYDALRLTSHGQVYVFDVENSQAFSLDDLRDEALALMGKNVKCLIFLLAMRGKQHQAVHAMMVIKPTLGFSVLALPFSHKGYGKQAVFTEFVMGDKMLCPLEGLEKISRELILRYGDKVPLSHPSIRLVHLDSALPPKKGYEVEYFLGEVLLTGAASVLPTLLAEVNDPDSDAAHHQWGGAVIPWSGGEHGHSPMYDSAIAAVAGGEHYISSLQSKTQRFIGEFKKRLKLDDNKVRVPSDVDKLLVDAHTRLDEITSFLEDMGEHRSVILKEVDTAKNEMKGVVKCQMETFKSDEDELDKAIMYSFEEKRLQASCVSVLRRRRHEICWDKKEERWQTREVTLCTACAMPWDAAFGSVLRVHDDRCGMAKARVADLKCRVVELEKLRENMQISQACDKVLARCSLLNAGDEEHDVSELNRCLAAVGVFACVQPIVPPLWSPVVDTGAKA